MPFAFNKFSKQLASALAVFDKQKTNELCAQLISYLYSSEDIVQPGELEGILKMLRNKRMFGAMQRLADCCIQTGRQSFKIRRQYAQSLIDQEIFTAALAVLTALQKDTAGKDKTENNEAAGLTGRVYKQVYINNNRPYFHQYEELLKKSVDSYAAVYDADSSCLWHGINLVALLKRAEADGIKIKSKKKANDIAHSILQAVQQIVKQNKNVYAFDLATALEASIALGDLKEAAEWLKKYIKAKDADAFEIASTLRQLQEVWRLGNNTELGKNIIPVLQAALLKKEGGNVVLDFTTTDIPEITSTAFKRKLEKTFGDTSFQTFDWYVKGLNCCKSVVRIGREISTGFGTGFLVKGDNLHPKLKNKIVLLTNAHVVSNDPGKNYDSLVPGECVASIQALDPKKELRFKNIFWSSVADKLDATVLEFDKESHDWLKAQKEIFFYNISQTLPLKAKKPRIYIIGYPGGGTLQLSLQDNVLIDEKPPFIHYRTPTEGGSSGSPVFDDQWQLIGIHHAGNEQMQRLDDPKRTYKANEGIFIQTILKELKKKK